MSITVAVVGAGRMGSVIARRLPPDTKKIIIDTVPAKASELAEAVGGSWSVSPEQAGDADLIALVVPASSVREILEKLQVLVKKGTVILNMATTFSIDQATAAKSSGITVIDAKIIGHAASMSRGEPGIVVAKTKSAEILSLIRNQLQGFADVVQGDADLVQAVNTIGSTEGIKAAVAVRKQLRAMGIPDAWTDVVIRSVCAGTMKAFTENDLGGFALELAKRLESEGQ